MNNPLADAQAKAKAAGEGKGANLDTEMQNNWKDRMYNPINDAEKCKISDKLNEDSGKYKKGPGPL